MNQSIRQKRNTEGKLIDSPLKYSIGFLESMYTGSFWCYVESLLHELNMQFKQKIRTIRKEK